MRFFGDNADYRKALMNYNENPSPSPNGLIQYFEDAKKPIPWPDPTPEMLKTADFEAVWQCIKHWDINVPGAYGGYCGATGNHVRAILDALAAVQGK